MAERFKNAPCAILCCVSAAFLLCGAAFMHAPLFVNAQSAEDEEFPEGITEEEKQKMLDEMYQDIENNAGASPDATLDTFNSMTDEEAREKIQEMLPSEEELERMTDDYSEHVMPVASFSITYEEKNGLYRYILPGGSGIALSTPLGGWSDHAVALLVDEGISVVSVIKDGETQSPGDDGSYFFRDHGHYSFIVYEEEAEAREFLSGSFRIVSPQVPVTDSYFRAPEGYQLSEVRVGGAPVSVSDVRWAELSGDGLYEITCEASNRGTSLPDSIRTTFVRDTTPPVIEWEGEVVDGRFRGSVYYSLPQPDTEVSIFYNGQPAISETHVLAATGNYYITATDPAGNVRVYSFVLEQSVNLPWMVIFAVLGVFFVIALILVATSGRGMRVR
ncbi:MAG: hypothetical protein K6C95_02555 [Lachnospiraceae bacterium]|nr:hypothetical protein [Lachnospiraceae bacterium]